MDLQELLGEELYNQVVEKAGENKLAVISDGNWIPKDKFNDKLEDIKNLKEQITSRDNQLEDLKKVDAEALQQRIQDLQEENSNTKTEYEDKLQKQSFDYALKDALTGAKVRNPKAAKALLDLESIKLDGDKLLGLDAQLNTIKESDPYLFEEEKPSDPTPQIVAGGNPQGGSAGGNDDPFAAKLAKYN
ncbi:phage scaffolding protein [Cytobacillus horneckiae]|uniref:Scaffolding protein n=1 Tax=Cytobacillus horneckiae TaxID=549687 RepID=A0A2N0ZMW3_9BACI|nr:phage scaffolding protein [Cytobacillus horneckiae]PKG30859.1 scaffolding protein [Cytobacillus horneckiae]